MTSAGHVSKQALPTQGVRLAVDMIPTLAWSACSDGGADFFNQRWLDYTGLSAEHARDWGWTAALHPDDLNGIADYWRSVFLSGEPGEIEGRLRRFDGEYRWFLFRATPSFDSDGRVVKWFGTNTDIEDRKRNEATLLENEERFRLIVDTIPGMVCTLNTEGEVELLNRQVLEYFGKTAEELKNWASSDAVHPDDLPSVIDAWRRSVESGQPYDLELRQRRADGEYRWFQSRALPTRDTDGPIAGRYLLLTDIDDRKRAGDYLRSNEHSLRQIVDSIPGFVSTANAAGEVELFNRQVLEYFGKTTEELRNWATSDAIHPDDLAPMIESYKRSIETGQPRDGETRSRRADGMYRWFHLRSRPPRDAEGRIVRWYNLVTDIDDRKRAEGELQKAFEEIAKSEAELRRITDAIPQVITVLGPDGKNLYANQAVLDYTGLTMEEVISREYRERVFHPEDVARLREERQTALARGIPFENEQRARRQDGQYRWFLVQYKPLRDERGKVILWD